MEYGVISSCEIIGKYGVIKAHHEAYGYYNQLTMPDEGYIQIGGRRDADFKCEINVSEDNTLKLSFRDSSDQLLGSVRITDKKFYDAMNLYHEHIEEFHRARSSGSPSEFKAADEARSIVHGEGTSQLMGILEHHLQNESEIVPVEFEGDFRTTPIRALFFLCTHAVHSQP